MKKIRKPIWKIKKNANGNEYAELLLRCHPHEFIEERERLQSLASSPMQATRIILGKFSEIPQSETSEIIDEMRRQHATQLAAMKEQLTATLGSLVVSGQKQGAPQQSAQSIIDDVWGSIDE